MADSGRAATHPAGSETQLEQLVFPSQMTMVTAFCFAFFFLRFFQSLKGQVGGFMRIPVNELARHD